MRTSRVITALAAAGLVAATVTGATSQADASTPAQGCTPAWNLVTTPAPPPGNTDTQLSGVSAVSAGDAWFSGWTEGSNGEDRPWVLHSNGQGLTQAAAPPQGPFTSRDASAGGSFDSAADGWILGQQHSFQYNPIQAGGETAARWNGGRWTIVPLAVSPDPTYSDVWLDAVDSLSPHSAWAVGDFYRGQQAVGALIEHWDGTQWSVVPNPDSSQVGAELNSITAVSASDIWAVGLQPNANGVTVPLAEHWDGTAWSVVPVPAGNSPSHFLAVSADGADDVWAVGAQTEAGTSDTGVLLAEHWDGTAWSVVSGLPDLGNAEVQRVYAASPDDVWATVYTVRTDGDGGVNDFLHWDGTSWTAVSSPGPQEYGLNYEYAGIDGSDRDNIWAVGYSFPAPDGNPAPLIAHLSCG
jgi:hypothetical protein